MIKTIIFDFDGTIADTLSTIVKLFNLRAKEFGFEKLTHQEIERLRNKSPLEIIKEFGISLLKIPIIATKIRGELNKEMTKIKIFPGVKKTLGSLKKRGFRLGILSSNSNENIEKFLKANGLMIFDFIHSEKNIFGKEEAMKDLLKKHGLKNDEVLYIGDEVRDIEACKGNGIKIITVTWGVNKKEVLQKNKPNYLVDSPQEILRTVLK